MKTKFYFEGFPYLLTQVVAALYHIILVPGDAEEDDLREVAFRQVTANRLKWRQH